MKALDVLCFSSKGDGLEPAAPAEIESGVEAGCIIVAESADELQGFLQWTDLGDRHVYVDALAVHPDHRGQGLAARIVDELMSGCDANVTVSTVTSPNNHAMLRLLFSRGFVVRKVMRDYFGPGKDRVYCQLSRRGTFVHPDDSYLVPAENLPELYALLGDERYVLTDLLVSSRGPVFEVSRLEAEDPEAAWLTEASTGVSFATAILAALTFLLGIGFAASRRYPGGVLAILVSAAVTSTGALLAYSNATGEVSRIRSNSFSKLMKWGNLLSEYGGVIPFVIVLPVTFYAVTLNRPAAVALAAVVGLALAGYEFSTFSIAHRYPHSWQRAALKVLTALLPLAAVVAPGSSTVSWGWTAATLFVLLLRVAVCARSSTDELSSAVAGRPARELRT